MVCARQTGLGRAKKSRRILQYLARLVQRRRALSARVERVSFSTERAHVLCFFDQYKAKHRSCKWQKREIMRAADRRSELGFVPRQEWFMAGGEERASLSLAAQIEFLRGPRFSQLLRGALEKFEGGPRSSSPAVAADVRRPWNDKSMGARVGGPLSLGQQFSDNGGCTYPWSISLEWRYFELTSVSQQNYFFIKAKFTSGKFYIKKKKFANKHGNKKINPRLGIYLEPSNIKFLIFYIWDARRL